MDFQFAPRPAVNFAPPRWIWTNESLDAGLRREAVRAAHAKLDVATDKLQAAKQADVADKGEIAAARKALDEAMAAVTAARDQLADAPSVHAIGQPGEVLARPDSDRHGVVFRRHVMLKDVPSEAYAAVAASQSFEVAVNGRDAKAALTNTFAGSRGRLYDLRSLLVKGDNVIAVRVISHTERGLEGGEREKHPESANHLNKTPGAAFYLRATIGGSLMEVVSDGQWHVRRAPAGDWRGAKLADDKWLAAQVLAPGSIPADEGPTLPPAARKPAARVDIAAALAPALALATEPAGVRASLRAADTMQVALERPNREVVVPVRSSIATTLQALELTNGATLDARLKAASTGLAAQAAKDPAAWLDQFYRHALSRPPSEAERTAALDLLGEKANAETVADVLWAVVNLPEFQFVE
jgi:hypothetical protein